LRLQTDSKLGSKQTIPDSSPRQNSPELCSRGPVMAAAHDGEQQWCPEEDHIIKLVVVTEGPK